MGTKHRDVICGLGGNDTLRGLGGNDVLIGGAGSDRLVGGPGKDVLIGERGADLMLGRKGADRMRGGDGADRMDGGSGSDRLAGGAGDDYLNGGPRDRPAHGRSWQRLHRRADSTGSPPRRSRNRSLPHEGRRDLPLEPRSTRPAGGACDRGCAGRRVDILRERGPDRCRLHADRSHARKRRPRGHGRRGPGSSRRARRVRARRGRGRRRDLQPARRLRAARHDVHVEPLPQHGRPDARGRLRRRAGPARSPRIRSRRGFSSARSSSTSARSSSR